MTSFFNTSFFGMIIRSRVKDPRKFESWSWWWVKNPPWIRLDTSFHVDSITSRCSGKEPALLPWSLFLRERRRDSRTSYFVSEFVEISNLAISPAPVRGIHALKRNGLCACETLRASPRSHALREKKFEEKNCCGQKFLMQRFPSDLESLILIHWDIQGNRSLFLKTFM